MKAAIITFPGSNCDRDSVDAIKKIGGNAINIWYKDSSLDDDLDLIILPGGFSYGDYLRSGAMAAASPIIKEVKGLMSTEVEEPLKGIVKYTDNSGFVLKDSYKEISLFKTRNVLKIACSVF